MKDFTLADFERWLAQMNATGYRPTNPQEIERIRRALKSGATMTTPERAE